MNRGYRDPCLRHRNQFRDELNATRFCASCQLRSICPIARSDAAARAHPNTQSGALFYQRALFCCLTLPQTPLADTCSGARHCRHDEDFDFVCPRLNLEPFSTRRSQARASPSPTPRWPFKLLLYPLLGLEVWQQQIPPLQLSLPPNPFPPFLSLSLSLSLLLNNPAHNLIPHNLRTPTPLNLLLAARFPTPPLCRKPHPQILLNQSCT